MSELQKLSGDVSELQDDMSHVKEKIVEQDTKIVKQDTKIVEHDTRFDMGRRAMAENRKDIEELQPKSPDWLKILLAGLTVVGILMAGQLWITDRLNDRPTQAEVDKRTAPIIEAQKETALEIKEIEKSQSAQQTSIKNIEKVQTQQGGKLDDILLRLPLRRRDR